MVGLVSLTDNLNLAQSMILRWSSRSAGSIQLEGSGKSGVLGGPVASCGACKYGECGRYCGSEGFK